MSFFDTIRESEIRGIFHFWCARRSAGGVPVRAAIDPSRIPHRLLPHLFLYAREKNERYRCRLIGTALVHTYGEDNTGGYLDEILPAEAARQRRELFEQALRTGLPIYFRGLAVMRSGEQRQYGRILLPIAAQGNRANQIFGLTRFGPKERPAPLPIAMRAQAKPRQIVFATAEDLEIAATGESEAETRTTAG